MASWSFVITIATVDTDITAHVDVMSIVKTRRLHSEMKPNSNNVSFRCKFDSGLFQKLLAADTVDIEITKDAAAYFTGSLSPNYQGQIRDGMKYIDLIAEDWNIQKLGQSVTSLIAYASFDVCKPSATATSIVHSLIAAAGCTAGTLDAIATTIPLFVVQVGDKATYASLLTDLLFQYGYVYYFDDDGTVDIAPISNSGSVTTTTTFTDAAGSSNIIGALAMSKTPEKYDDIRVTYDKLEAKTGIVLFQDTTGATGSDACQIQLEESGDADGKDYYPLTSGAAEVFSEWANPDGLKIWAATSAALSSTIETGITASRALTNYYKRCSFAYHNGEATPKLITKLTITGDAYVIVSRNTARSTTGKKLYEIDAKYIYTDAAAQALLQAVAQYYKFSDISFTLKSKTAAAIGSYALVTDSIYSGTSTKCRIIDRIERSAFDGTYEYRLEAVADFASIAITAEAKNESAVTQTPAWYASNGYKLRRIYIRAATKPAQPTGGTPAGWQETPPLPAVNPLWSSWIYVKATGDYIDPVYPSTSLYPGSGLYPSFPVTWSEVEYVSEEDPQIAIDAAQTAAQSAAVAQIPTLAPKYLGRFFADHPTARNTGDWWTTYNTSSTNRGVWYDLAGAATQVTTSARPELFVEALTDVAWAEEQAIYGTASDYGIATLFQSLGVVTAFIQKLFAQYIKIQTGGSVRGGDRYDESGAIIDGTKPGFFIAASGACKVAGIEFGGAGAGGVQWGGPILSGTPLSISGAGPASIAALTGTDIAYIDLSNYSLRAYRFNGNTWAQVGSSLALSSGPYFSITALNNSEIALVSIESGSGTLCKYSFDGSAWTQYGSVLSLTGVGSAAITALNQYTVAVADVGSEELRAYEFDGTDWTQLGSALTISGMAIPSLTTLNETDIAFIDAGASPLQAYRFSGTSWAEIGNGKDVYAGIPAISSINGSDIVCIDSTFDTIRIYRFDGTDWTQVGSAGETGIALTDYPALSALNGTDVAYFDSTNGTLRLYRFSFSTAIPYMKTITGF